MSIQLQDGGEERYKGVDVAHRSLDLHIARGFLEVKIRRLSGVAKPQKDIVMAGGANVRPRHRLEQKQCDCRNH